MLITLMRHGDAAATAPSDALRPLTGSGRREVQVVAGLLGSHSLPDAIISSPYLRARQTAAIVAETNQLLIAPQWPEITPLGSIDTVMELVFQQTNPVFLVFHMPLIAQLIYALTGERINVPTASVFTMALPAGQMTGAKMLWKL
ncbi:MAG TPA: phosphohistidine phosphatase SixA [Gammaproteobacteria bacterium]|nr:phosphohistidine phosphatase SixA [Gammaproteobacteria bacterium]HIK69252.1 phosphohistidine phosphatase SixA [Pseudomonadales bacterium]